jgi:hypothetical protein
MLFERQGIVCPRGIDEVDGEKSSEDKQTRSARQCRDAHVETSD